MLKGVPVSPGVAVARAYCVDEVLARREPHHLDASAPCPPRSVASRAPCRCRDGTRRHRRPASASRSARTRPPSFEAIACCCATRPSDRQSPHHHLDKHVDARTALQEALDEYTKLFEKIQDEYLKERMADMRDVVGRIMAQLALQPGAGQPAWNATSRSSSWPRRSCRRRR